MIALIEGYADESKPFDFGRKAQFFTLDVISDLAFGEPFGFVASDSDMYEYIETTEENLPVFMGMTVVPWVIRLFRYPLLRSMLPTEKDPLGFGKVMG